MTLRGSVDLLHRIPCGPRASLVGHDNELETWTTNVESP